MTSGEQEAHHQRQRRAGKIQCAYLSQTRTKIQHQRGFLQ